MSTDRQGTLAETAKPTTWAQARPPSEVQRLAWQDGRLACRNGLPFEPHQLESWRRGWICEAELSRAAPAGEALPPVARIEIEAALQAAEVVADHLVTTRPSPAQRTQIEEARESIRRALHWFRPANAA